MLKVIFILTTAIVLSCGCSVSRKAIRENRDIVSYDAKKVLQKAGDQNITNSSFFIERGKISTSGEGGRINLLFTMKYAQPGRYLISLRSTTGIEAFRVYLTEDTILINDRIKKLTLYGKPSDFERISGLPSEMMKIVVGDLFINSEKMPDESQCADNELTVNDYYEGLMIKSIIDCKLGKTKTVTLTSGIPDEQISISYFRFKTANFKIPGRIEIKDFRRKVKILIKIEKYSVPWIGEINLIPVPGYKVKKLL